ncbi:TM0106 family RecB-like putative nuclease [Corynebacterium sp. H127]|uniref:TM0106 family RecB-like putative nuclease n=1 Tax=Corynebacterium sp. H127 TaxID=3133418 RepID=UPI0030AE778A
MTSPSELVGCRYRAVQRAAHPDVPPTEAAQARAARIDAALAAVHNLLPQSPAMGDARYFRRVSAGKSYFETLECLAAGDTLITEAVLEWGRFQITVDILVAFEDGYLPIMVSNHRAARNHSGVQARYLAVPRLGLGSVLTGEFKIRHHALDTYRLALAGRALSEMDLSCGLGGTIGQDRTRAFLEPLAPLDEALTRALQVETPRAPRRVKECDSCRYWSLCSVELERADDISLLLPGDRANPYRERGIHTVGGLIEADLGEASLLAAAFRSGQTVVPRGLLSAPRFDVELFIDLEAYLDQGAYLWGAWDGSAYHAFTAWSLAEEASAFADFWAYLCDTRATATANGQTFGAFCYSAHGENHWMRASARRFAGQPGVPTVAEVEEFINSGYWVDVFQLVRAQLIGPFGLGLKVVAPAAGYHYSGDVDGESSVNLFLDAAAGSAAARTALLNYNEDDCRATAAVRDFLERSDAPL